MGGLPPCLAAAAPQTPRESRDEIPATGRQQNSQFSHEWALDLASGADTVCSLALLFEADPFPGLPGPAVDPGGAKIDQNKGRSDFLTFPKSHPALLALFAEAGPFPGLPGPAAGPGGPEIDRNILGRIYLVVLHNSAAGMATDVTSTT